MTPIPADVAAIVTAAHTLAAEPVAVSGRGLAEWRWSSCSGRVDAPEWDVEVGGYCAVAPTPRAALLKALDRLAAASEGVAAESRDEARHARSSQRKAFATERADAASKRAADARALAERVAAMWPEATP